MALTTSKLSNGSLAIDRETIKRHQLSSSPKRAKFCSIERRVEFGQKHNRNQFVINLKCSQIGLWRIYQNQSSFFLSRDRLSVSCQSRHTEACECETTHTDKADASKARCNYNDDDVMPKRSAHSSQGLAQFVCNDAKYVNERAKNDIVLLSRGILSLDARVRQDVAIISTGFLKLDDQAIQKEALWGFHDLLVASRARKDTMKIDMKVKEKANHLHRIASILKDKAQSRLKKAADKHWSDGALEADLKRADFYAKQRAMEDALMALEFVKDIHDIMVTTMYNLKEGPQTGNSMAENITIEKNGKTLGFFPGEVSTDRITAIQEAYLSMASAVFEEDGIDYADPEELELLVSTLIDLDAMDGKSSVSLLAECSSSPDVNTRKALANALATAPSMWTLGNAGMGALQRLAEDSNPSIAAAAWKAIYELKQQWEIKEGDTWRFMMNENLVEKVDDDDDSSK